MKITHHLWTNLGSKHLIQMSLLWTWLDKNRPVASWQWTKNVPRLPAFGRNATGRVDVKRGVSKGEKAKDVFLCRKGDALRTSQNNDIVLIVRVDQPGTLYEWATKEQFNVANKRNWMINICISWWIVATNQCQLNRNRILSRSSLGPRVPLGVSMLSEGC